MRDLKCQTFPKTRNQNVVLSLLAREIRDSTVVVVLTTDSIEVVDKSVEGGTPEPVRRQRNGVLYPVDFATQIRRRFPQSRLSEYSLQTLSYWRIGVSLADAAGGLLELGKGWEERKKSLSGPCSLGPACVNGNHVTLERLSNWAQRAEMGSEVGLTMTSSWTIPACSCLF